MQEWSEKLPTGLDAGVQPDHRVFASIAGNEPAAGRFIDAQHRPRVATDDTGLRASGDVPAPQRLVARCGPESASVLGKYDLIDPFRMTGELVLSCPRSGIPDTQVAIIIADNGSDDRSRQIAIDHGARVVEVPERGYGRALLSGMIAAQGEFILMGDCDGSYNFMHASRFVEKLRAGNDFVIGNRFQGGIAMGAMPWSHRYLGNPVLSGLGRWWFQVPVRDFHCGLRAIRRSVVEQLGLASPGMEFASEMVIKAAMSGLRICEVPTVLRPDGRGRPSHLRSVRDGWRHLSLMVSLGIRTRCDHRSIHDAS